jgi:lipid A 3-O-deacylase
LAAAFAWVAALGAGAADAFALPREARLDAPQAPAGVFSFSVDNDMFARTDRRYTSGFRFAWTWPELGRTGALVKLPRWLDVVSRALSFDRVANGGRFVSLAIQQLMYTPEDITRADVPDGEQPYAGYTGLRLAFHSRGTRTLDTVALDLGLVGPDSGVGATQRFWHRTLGYYAPNGWDNQLEDEPVLGISIDHLGAIVAAKPGPGLGLDAVVRAGASLGNAFTAGWTGAEIRAGWNIPGDFGPLSALFGAGGESLPDATIRAAPSFYGYLSAEGQIVVRDIFLDGNSLGDGPSVAKYPLRGRIEGGLAARWGRSRMSFGYVVQSRWYETERRGHVYGKLGLSLAF